MSGLLRPRRALGLACAVAALGIVVPLAADALSASVATLDPPGAAATEPAVRVNRLCTKVVVIGDSLTVGAATAIRKGFDGLPIEYSVTAISGIKVTPEAVQLARELRAASGEADCWVIALGTNDITARGVTTTALANTMIDTMLAEVSPKSRIFWVNVNLRTDDARISATKAVNQALDARAAKNASFQVIDWYSLSQNNLGWFGTDGVHYTSAGYSARAAQLVEVIRRNSER
jgi:hypothetical protein